MALLHEKNEFLTKLLALQQDGKDAISAPSNWSISPPLLNVETELGKVIERIADRFLAGNNGENHTGYWYFLIGSPGNGKSAAMGKLSKLLLRKGCVVCDENCLNIDELDPLTIPYAIDIYENGKNYISAKIVQDASVVRNPYSNHVDPAADLISTIKQAWEKGISLIVCTNRGVLEKAYRDNHPNRDLSSLPWFSIIDEVVSSEFTSGELKNTYKFEGKKPVFQELKVGYCYLDNRSLLLGTDLFESLISNAVNEEHWSVCRTCLSSDFCPFWLNRTWLCDEQIKRNFLQLMKRAEVFSGQVIVFREALAIISFILSGCPKDYETMHPCDWVRNKVANQDVFALAFRRIYMNLFASNSPFGLEEDSEIRSQQKASLRTLLDSIDKEKYRKPIEHILTDALPSTEVGVSRLFGKGGVMAVIDPCRDSLPKNFYDKWDTDIDAVAMNSDSLTRLEKECISIWKALEDSLEAITDYSVSRAHWALKRWSSNFLLHMGALLDAQSAFAAELDVFTELLGLFAISTDKRSLEQKTEIYTLCKKVEKLLNNISEESNEPTIRLSEAVTLSGNWVSDKLKPKISNSSTSGSNMNLTVDFIENETATFAAPVFIWLTHAAKNLDIRCFPKGMLNGIIDARVRAASKGKYAFENEVKLVISSEKGEAFNLVRLSKEEVILEP